MNNTNINTSKRIRKMILKMGIDPSLQGYKYLFDAVSLAYADQKYINAITKSLYPAVAKMNDTTMRRAERAIRHAIEKMSDMNFEIYDVLPCVSAHKGKYTNSQMIAYCVELLRLEDEENV